MSKILIVEDEPKVADAVCEGLTRESHSVSIARSGEDAYSLLDTESFDLVVLDIMLPGRSGIEILQAVRGRGITVPVLLLTARDAVGDRVAGLDAGADDYLVKPFVFAELSARVRALLRRTRLEIMITLKVLDLEVDLIARSVTRAGRSIELTSREFDLLEYLLRHEGRVVSRDMLARDVWKEPSRPTPIDNVIDVHMVRLRRKVDEGFGTRLLHTLRGVGFMLRADQS